MHYVPCGMTLPNLLTIARLLLVPVFVVLYRTGNHTAALAVFAAAAITDGLDGMLARALHQESRLGSILDPTADKLLTLAALILLVSSGQIPGWLLVIVLLRDGGLVGGTLLLYFQGTRVPVVPSRFGKYATFLLVSTVALALAKEMLHARLLAPYVFAFSVIAAECVMISGGQYFAQWLSLMRRRRIA